MEDKKIQAEQAQVPFFIHENAMMHKDRDNKRMMVINLCLCAVVIFVVITLVSFYTSRTQMWNDTISKLTVALTEVTNAKEASPPGV